MSLWLTDSELDAIRADIEQLMPDSVIIKRLVESVDSYGGVTKTYSAVGTVAGRIDNLSARVTLAGMQEKGVVKMQLTVPWDADLLPDDRIEVSGITYELVGAQLGQSDKACKRGQIARVQ